MIDAPEDRNDVRPIRPDKPADTLIESERAAAPVARPLTVIAVVPVDDILDVLRSIVFQAVAAALTVAAIGAAIGLAQWRDNDR